MPRPDPRSRPRPPAPRRGFWLRALGAGFWGVSLAVAALAAASGCSGWDPRAPFERSAPPVDEALRALDAGKPEPAEETLQRYLGTGRCSADGGIGVPPAVLQKPNGSFDLGLTLFHLGERFGRRFGDEELGDGGPQEEALAAKRSAEIDCALLIVRAIAADPKVPPELRARARYLAGNLEFMRRKYEDAVKEYDQALGLVPGLAEDSGGDGLGRDAAWNRAIALRRIQDQKDAGTDAPDAADAADASDASDAMPLLHAPDAPTNVVATGGVASATIGWTPPANNGGSPITGYTVTSSRGDLLTVAGNVTSTPMMGLTAGLSYTFSVAATNAIGTGPSATSNQVVVLGPPQPPTNGNAARGDQSATVSWIAPTNIGGGTLSGYTVTSSPGSFTVMVAPNVTSAPVNGLTNGTAYTFTVTASNQYGTSAASSPSNSVTPAGVPSSPTNVTATAVGSGSVSVAWTAPSNNGSPITGYSVTSNPGGVVIATGATGTTFNGLSNCVSYSFTVTATNSVGTSAPSSASSSATPTSAPNTPTGVLLVPGAAQIAASWSAPANNGCAIDSYRVEAYRGGTTLVATASPASTSWTTTNLTTCNYPVGTCGQSYTLFVYAHNAGGYSAPSIGASAVPKVSYLADNLRAIFSKSYGSGTCTGCHISGHAPTLMTSGNADYTAAKAEGALIYQCPSGGCTGIMSGFSLFSTSSTEYAVLRQWVMDGSLL